MDATTTIKISAASLPQKFVDLQHMREGHAHEKRDCSVVAYSIVAEMPYTEAHKTLQQLGRKARCGCYFSQLANRLNLYQRADLACKQISTALRDMQQGRFVVRVSGHVMAVVDGCVIDAYTTKPTRITRMVYQYSTNGALDARGNRLQLQSGD